MKKKKKLSKKKILIVLMLFAFVALGTSTFAKYIIEEFHSYYLNSKHFYFTSNRLKKNNPTYLVNNWSGVGSFNISFDLLSEKNSLVYTDYDIPYVVTFECPSDVDCSVDKPTGTIFSASNTHSDTVTLSVNPTRSYSENERLTIQIIAKSTSPYEETIKAVFSYVVGKKGITYEIEDEANRPYMVLKITNAINYCTVTEAFGSYQIGDQIENNVYRQLNSNDLNKCVGEEITLNFDPNTIILDTTSNILKAATIGNTMISGVDYVNMLRFNINPVSTMAIKFYKKNIASNYTYPIVNSNSIVSVTYTS